jgi:hypothetical protein
MNYTPKYKEEFNVKNVDDENMNDDKDETTEQNKKEWHQYC